METLTQANVRLTGLKKDLFFPFLGKVEEGTSACWDGISFCCSPVFLVSQQVLAGRTIS